MRNVKKKDIRRYEEANYDLDFLAQVQPQGNMQVHSRYIEFIVIQRKD